MKHLSIIIAAATAFSSIASGSPQHHGHSHHHNKKRDVNTVTVPGLEVVYVFEGKDVSVDDVCKGLSNGTFEMSKGSGDMPDCKSPSPAPSSAPAPAPAPAPIPSSAPPASGELLQGSKPAPPSSSSVAPAPSLAPQTSGNAASGPVGLTGYYAQITNTEGVDTPFPDGSISCNTFPSQYGPVRVDWLGLEGWTSVQNTNIVNEIVGDIETAVSGGCVEKAYCSYSCPQGFMKTQFPAQNSGTSVGGLLCSNGKLTKTNPNFDTLCTRGAGSASIDNGADDILCFCGTNYPGDEAETVPICVESKGNGSLAITEGSSYYKHLSATTSAEYYINPAGVSVDKACRWGSDQTSAGHAVGNWAPVVAGVGKDDDNNIFLSLMSTEQNYPEAIVALNYNIELVGDFSGSSCSYSVVNGQGQFCDQSGCEPQGQFWSTKGAKPVPGCTVQLFSGEASYKITSI